MSCRPTNLNSSVHWTQANHPQANWIYAIVGLESRQLYSASIWRKISCASELRLIQNDWGGSQFQSPPKATCRRLGGAKMFWGGLKIKTSSEWKLQWEHQLKVLDSSKWRVASLWSVIFSLINFIQTRTSRWQYPTTWVLQRDRAWPSDMSPNDIYVILFESKILPQSLCRIGGLKGCPPHCSSVWCDRVATLPKVRV